MLKALDGVVSPIVLPYYITQSHDNLLRAHNNICLDTLVGFLLLNLYLAEFNDESSVCLHLLSFFMKRKY